jgi:predicted HTH domain antitoxin
MASVTIDYPSELSAALGKRPEDAVREIRLMAALKLFESGRISSGMAAKLAGMNRVEFLFACGQYGVSVFQQTPEEVESDVKAALDASRG